MRASVKCLAVIMTTLLSRSVPAQQPDSLAALRELAVLVATGGSLDAVLRLGRPGPGMPPEILDSTARVIGSLAEGSGSRTFIVVPGFPDSVRAAFEKRLLAAGWEQNPNQMSQTGFMAPRGVIEQFCKGNESIMPMIQPRVGRESLVMIHHYTGFNTPCDQLGAVRNYQMSMGPMPRLYPAPGMALMGGGTQPRFPGHGASSLAIISTRRPLEDIRSHFGPQLERAGWTAGEKVDSPTILAQTWRLTDSTGAFWSGLLLIHAIAENQRELLFSITRTE
jgi:hypothetical protein